MNEQEREFTAFVKKHKSTIYTVCLMFSDDKAEVDDLVQQVLINIWQGFPDFRRDSSERTWIWRIAMNTCISADRKQSRRPDRTSLDAIGLNAADTTSDTPDDRQIRLLHQRIHHLPYIDRAIVLLWLEDLTYEEIGSIVGISAKNVSVRLVRIREQLKNMQNNE